jgi:hypothetical protein
MKSKPLIPPMQEEEKMEVSRNIEVIEEEKDEKKKMEMEIDRKGEKLILIIDDDFLSSQIMVKILRKENYKTQSVHLLKQVIS